MVIYKLTLYEISFNLSIDSIAFPRKSLHIKSLSYISWNITKIKNYNFLLLWNLDLIVWRLPHNSDQQKGAVVVVIVW
jgi:hypothetical protein